MIKIIVNSSMIGKTGNSAAQGLHLLNPAS
jgi:hypothetical protein